MKNILIFFFLSVLLVSCSTTSKLTSSFIFPLDQGAKTYENLAVLAFFPVMNNRATLESTLENEFRARNIKATATFQTFPLAGDKEIFNKMGLGPEEIKDLIRAKVVEHKVDAFMTISLVDKTQEENYVQGASVSFSAPYAYQNDFGFYDYYSYAYSSTYSSGYYSTTTSYYLQMNLFDIETEQLIWSGQSKTTDPQNIEKGSLEYARMVVDEILRLNVLKP